ncbi:MAG: ATP-dependent helicase [Verrucomicrobiota bacterium]
MTRDYTIQPSPKSASKIDFAAELNEPQYAAVTAPPGPSLVIAGAGSGKTRTLTYRVAYLLETGVDPRNILLLTFTNKAAREMLERVESLVPMDTRDLWGGTFHSVGNRILRQHASLLEYTSSFSILDREDQKDLMNTVIGESDVDTKAVRFPKADVLCDLFSMSTNTGDSIAKLVTQKYSYFDNLIPDIEALGKAYGAKKVATNSMDFDDLLAKTLQLLDEQPVVRETLQKKFQWVLVDEYQDTNRLQSDLIDRLAAPQYNLMVVGDDAQSIYSWRGADFTNILEFPERYENARRFVIETNYRSVPEILTLANAAILPNRRQFRKNLAPHRPDAMALPARVPVNDPPTQAAFVAQRILELRDEGIELEEIAILYRAHFHAMEIQLELTNRGIPYLITSGLRFFEQAHIKDAAAFMRFASNRLDVISFKRLVKMLPGIGVKSADSLWVSWTKCEGSARSLVTSFSEYFLDFKVPAKAKHAWEQFAYTLDELMNEDGKPLPPSAMMPSILGGVYEDYMRSKYSNFENRQQDLLQLEKYAERFDDVEEFLSQLSLLAGQDAANATQDEPDSEAVCLSSVHQAKGLEWRVVFVVWLTDSMFPNNRVLSEDEDETGLEEERRLFYVAVTRAKDELYLTYPISWPTSFTGDVLQRPSRFLEDINPELMEEWNTGATW